MLTFIGFLFVFIGIVAVIFVAFSLIFKPFKYQRGKFWVSLVADLAGSLLSVAIPIVIALIGLLILYISE